MANLTLNSSTTALILIDLQNGIVGQESLAPHSGPAVVERGVELANALRAGGGTVVFVHVLISDVLSLPADQPRQGPKAPASASELVPEIVPQPNDVIVTKRQWGAFYGTQLDQALRRRGIRTIIMGGISTNFGVESTARAAFDRGYELVFAEDAMTSMSPEAHQFPVATIFPRMGRVRSTMEILEAVRS